jgi:hypothetical protein
MMYAAFERAGALCHVEALPCLRQQVGHLDRDAALFLEAPAERRLVRIVANQWLTSDLAAEAVTLELEAPGQGPADLANWFCPLLRHGAAQ